MAVIEKTDEDLATLIYTEEYIVIKYYTNDCSTCNILSPVFEKFSNSSKYAKVVFVKIKADRNLIAQQYIKIYDTPVMVSYKNGLLINSNTVSTKSEMQKFINSLINFQTNIP